MQEIIKKPTNIKTGAVACAGIDKKSGAKKRDRKKQTAITKAVNPDFPPTETPAALSHAGSDGCTYSICKEGLLHSRHLAVFNESALV